MTVINRPRSKMQYLQQLYLFISSLDSILFLTNKFREVEHAYNLSLELEEFVSIL